jgi:uncharacterized protein YdeI (BOF family)
MKNSMPLEENDQPNECQPIGTKECNDTYVLALVAYYQVKEPNAIWCQPSGDPASCPTRIVRYQIKDGLRNPYSRDPLKPYFTGVTPAQEPSPAFNPGFDISNPTQNVTIVGKVPDDFKNPEVLVNYIDHSQKEIDPLECQKVLGNPTTQTGTTTAPIEEKTLRVTDTGSPTNTNSFYACVDTARNVARVTIRGNSLRRIQTDAANYDDEKAAYFPTASVQVQGLGARGR